MTIAKPQTHTLIDIISAGYVALNRRLWVLLIPIAFNLYMAYGAQVSLAPLLHELRANLSELPAEEQSSSDLLLRMVDLLERADMRQPLLMVNYVPLLANYSAPPADVVAEPAPAATGLPLLDPRRSDTIEVDGVPMLLVLLALLNAAGLLISDATTA